MFTGLALAQRRHRRTHVEATPILPDALQQGLCAVFHLRVLDRFDLACIEVDVSRPGVIGRIAEQGVKGQLGVFGLRCRPLPQRGAAAGLVIQHELSRSTVGMADIHPVDLADKLEQQARHVLVGQIQERSRGSSQARSDQP